MYLAGKTVTAPLDRVKLLLQTSGALTEGALGQAVRQGNLWKAFTTIGREEGLRGYWKGNTPQVHDFLILNFTCVAMRMTKQAICGKPLSP